MNRAREIALFFIALSGAAIGSSGCHIAFDGTRRDAQAAVQAFLTLGDCAYRDLVNYERVGEPGPRIEIEQP